MKLRRITKGTQEKQKMIFNNIRLNGLVTDSAGVHTEYNIYLMSQSIVKLMVLKHQLMFSTGGGCGTDRG